MNYPSSRRSNHVDTYQSSAEGEVKVPDPYRWLEDCESDEIQPWVDDQRAFTKGFLDHDPAYAGRLRDPITQAMNYSRHRIPFRAGGWWYWLVRGDQEQGDVRIYRSKEEKFQKPELFFDVVDRNLTDLTLLSFSLSPDGCFFACNFLESGSAFITVKVSETSAPHEFKWVVEDVKFSRVVWTQDSNGFFTQRFPRPTCVQDPILHAKVYYYRIRKDGDLLTPAEKICIVENNSEPRTMWKIDVTHDRAREYIVLSTFKNSSGGNGLSVIKFDPVTIIERNVPWTTLFDDYHYEYQIIANIGTKLFVRTNIGAPSFQLITIDIESREIITVIPRDPVADLLNVRPLYVAEDNSIFLTVYTRYPSPSAADVPAATNQIRIFATNFNVTSIMNFNLGSISVESSQEERFFFVQETGYNTPNKITRYNLPDLVADVWINTTINGLEQRFTESEVWYESKDTTMVPMSIIRSNKIKEGTAAPFCVQLGYGGFGVPMYRSFGPALMAFLDVYGGALAVPYIRGGSELGSDWHHQARCDGREKVYDDFIAATNYLEKNNIVEKQRVAIFGQRNGGLLVASCVNRADPGTFGVAIAQNGTFDLLRFHNFGIGKQWMPEYGNPENPDHFDFIHPLSPLHNVRCEEATPTLIVTFRRNERTVPLHSFKYTAELQYKASANGGPMLITIHKYTHCSPSYGIHAGLEARLKLGQDEHELRTFLVTTLMTLSQEACGSEAFDTGVFWV